MAAGECRHPLATSKPAMPIKPTALLFSATAVRK
jgi:hypothetical protein